MAKKLGKLPYVPDSRSLKLADYFTDKLPSPPDSSNWDHYVKLPWGMCLNDALGDCTCACAAHMILAWSSSADAPVVIPDASVLTAYEAVSGYDPTTQTNDNGAEIIGVLKYWQKQGLDGHKIGAFAEVNVENHVELKQAINLFGGVDIGVQLPIAAQGMGSRWTSPKGKEGNWAPGSWGGHCICIVDYDNHEGTFTAVSWGELITIDSAFFDAYVDEAWAVVSKDILNSSGEDVQGLDIAQLNADLNSLSPKAEADEVVPAETLLQPPGVKANELAETRSVAEIVAATPGAGMSGGVVYGGRWK